MKHYLACYDVSDHKNRLHIARLLQFYGTRVQKSVFEIGLKTPTHFEQLKHAARDSLAPGDSLRFYRLTEASRQASHDCYGNRIAYFPATLIIS